MSLVRELTERGFIHQSSAELSTIFDGTARTIYLGIDPTADSIHVGNLVPYMLLNHLMNAGHKVILLMGGGTALIGDPGGKSEERPFVEQSVVAEQCEKMEAGVRRFVSGDVTFVNNYDWLSQLSMIEYLRDIGKHFTVNAMIKKDIVANRLEAENPISYTEFSYSLLQGYDYVHLHKEFGCDVQIGGSDQWSNIIAGVDLIRRSTGNEVYALTNPIITDKATGKKFGKSEGNAIWLNADKTSPYELYQFWLNTSDESVVDYLKVFTFISLEEIADIERSHNEDKGARIAQKRLADAVTAFVHGEASVRAAAEVSEVLFGGTLVSEVSDQARQMIIDTAPGCNTQSGQLLVDVLIQADLASSKREAREFIENGAISIDGQKITDVETVITNIPTQLLKRGKKQLCVLQVQ